MHNDTTLVPVPVVLNKQAESARRRCRGRSASTAADRCAARCSSMGSGLSRLDEEPAERPSPAHLRTRSADVPLSANVLSPAAAGRLQAKFGTILAAAQHQQQPQADAAAVAFKGMPQQELLLHMLSQIQQQQQAAQPTGGERVATAVPNGSHRVEPS